MGLSTICQWILVEGSVPDIQFDRPELIIQNISDLLVEICKL